MPVLMIGEAERRKVTDLIAYAKAHPVLLDIVRQGAIDGTDTVLLKDRKPGFERPPSQHMMFPGGYRAAFSIEQQPFGMCSHLSISVEGRAQQGLLPSPQAVVMIADAFGMSFPADRMWQEEYDPGEFAINLVSLYAPTPAGRA